MGGQSRTEPALKVSDGEHQRHDLSSGSDQLVHLRGPLLSARRIDGAKKGAVVDEVVGCLRRVSFYILFTAVVVYVTRADKQKTRGKGGDVSRGCAGRMMMMTMHQPSPVHFGRSAVEEKRAGERWDEERAGEDGMRRLRDEKETKMTKH